MSNPNNALGTNAAYRGRTSVPAVNDVLAMFDGAGIVSGFEVSVSDMTISLGGETSVRDVAIASAPNGDRTTVNNISHSPIAIALAANANDDTYQSVVAYVKNPPEIIDEDNRVVDSPEVVNIVVVTKTSGSPVEADIRTAIVADGGSAQDYYVTLANARVPAGATSLSGSNVSAGAKAAISSSSAVDTNAYTISADSWSSLDNKSPYKYAVTVPANNNVDDATLAELYNDQPVLFANYGFAIGEVDDANDTITFYAVALPETAVTLTVAFTNAGEQVPASGISVRYAGSTQEWHTGESYALEASVLPANATNKGILWTSSDPTVATVTIANGVYTATVLSAGSATITATTVDGGYSASFDVTAIATARIIMTFADAFIGGTWTVSGGGTSQTGEVGASKTAKALVTVLDTTYTISVSNPDGSIIGSQTLSVNAEQTYTANMFGFPTAITFADAFSGQNYTINSPNEQFAGTAPSGGGAVDVTVAELNTTYTITSTTADGDEYTATFTTPATYDGTGITTALETAHVTGVSWNYANSSTAMTRLTRAADSLITKDIDVEPVAALGTGAGSSPFDDIMPWAGMKKYNITNGVVGPSEDDAGFSTSNEVFVYIPAFWYKVVDDTANSTRKYYISSTEQDGFTKHPGSDRYVGRYTAGSGYVTKTGLAPLVNITRATARTGFKNRGTGYYQYDYITWNAICMLYQVEFANWNSQTMVGYGLADQSSASASGATDSMKYHTGTAATARGSNGAIQYRNIENLWGNVFQWIDGCLNNGGTFYVGETPSNYADSTSGLTNVGSVSTSNGYTSGLRYSSTKPYAYLPSAVSGSDSTYIPDRFYGSTSSSQVCDVGGRWSNGANAGLFYFGASVSASGSGSDLGCRAIYIPQ